MLTAERILLMARAQDERARLAAALVPSDTVASLAARIGRIFEWAMANPLFSGTALALLAWKRPRALLGWVARGATFFRLYEELRRRFAAREPGFQR